MRDGKYPSQLTPIVNLDIYVNYPGTCQDAFSFYEQHLGAKRIYTMTHGEAPESRLPPEWAGKVLHASIELGGTLLRGADIPGTEPMRSAYLTLRLVSDEEAERVYALLSDGGQVFMKMEKTFFASRFAMLRDRFGTNWMLMHQP